MSPLCNTDTIKVVANGSLIGWDLGCTGGNSYLILSPIENLISPRMIDSRLELNVSV